MRRWPPLLIGTVAAVVALVAAVGVGAGVSALDGDPAGPPDPELDLTFDAGDEESGTDDLIGGDMSGELAPGTTFALLAGGSMSLDDLRGQPVVVNFFASWCAPCVAEMPELEAVHQELRDRVAFVGIDVRDSVTAAEELVEKTGVTYTIGRDPSGGLFQEFGAINMPSTFLISAEGVVVGNKAGAMDAAELRERIHATLL